MLLSEWIPLLAWCSCTMVHFHWKPNSPTAKRPINKQRQGGHLLGVHRKPRRRDVKVCSAQAACAFGWVFLVPWRHAPPDLVMIHTFYNQTIEANTFETSKIKEYTCTCIVQKSPFVSEIPTTFAHFPLKTTQGDLHECNYGNRARFWPPLLGTSTPCRK